MRKLLIYIATFLSVLTLAGCASTGGPTPDKPNQLTQGNVSLNLHVGTTTEADVLKVFGAPNIVTNDNGKQVWSYQRASSVSRNSAKEGYFTILLAGGSGATSNSNSTQRMTTLIMTFNKQNVLENFSSQTSDF